MDERDATVVREARRLHADTPHAVRVSVTLSNDTREVLSEIRDDLNERAGESILNTNDVVRLALRGAARYHEIAPPADEESHPDFRTLTAAVREAMDGREDSD